MEKKKNPKANLEKSKSMFLFIGLIAAISALIFAFSWNSEVSFADNGIDETYIEEEMIINTENNLEEEKKEPIQKPIPKLVVAEIIHISDDPNLVDTAGLWTEDYPDVPDFEPEPEPEPDILDYSGTAPEFPGGNDALQYWIAKHVEYPALARENNIEGTVYLRFEVTKTGTIGKIEIQNTSIDMILQEASIEVIKKLPKFKPGIHNGQKVNVWFSIPIKFKLK